MLRNQNLTRTRYVQAVARRLYPTGEVRNVRRGPLKGLRFRVAPGMGFTFAWGIGVEQWDFSSLVQPGMCVYDIGANCGQSTLHLAALVGAAGRVIAFEPVECVFANLVFNLALNSLSNVTAVPAAVSEKSGQVDFYFDANCTTQGYLAGGEPAYLLPEARAVSVRAVRLDNYNLERWPPPQLLKIDVEGGARAVLSGAKKLLTAHRPRIYIELHGPEEQQATDDLLKTFGYRARTLSGLEVQNPTVGWLSPLICEPK
jgi:FkbM family methyltransferase